VRREGDKTKKVKVDNISAPSKDNPERCEDCLHFEKRIKVECYQFKLIKKLIVRKYNLFLLINKMN
jgi:hypothetical protein